MTSDDTSLDASDGLPDQELEPGVSLNNGQFTITKFLASGGFGMTYLAKDNLDRDVVVKECFPSALCHRRGNLVAPAAASSRRPFESVVRLFVREAKAMAKLVHPNIIGVHQIFEDNDTAYMAIDFVDGCDLLDVIEDEALELSPERLVAWLRKLLTAVEFVHDHDVLHRDISPDNILVDRYDNPILIDFGAARDQATKASRALTMMRVVKDGYSPQEFYVEGSAQGNSSDLYALGATFYHLIEGEAPPNSQSRLAAVAEGRKDPYQPLSGRFEGYPEGFLEAIDVAVKVLPNERLQSAREWIKRIDAGGPISAPKPLDFEFDAIRDEVARIAEEFEEDASVDLAELTALEPDFDGDVTYLDEEALEKFAAAPSSRKQGFQQFMAASVGLAVLLGSAFHLSGYVGADRIAALAIITTDHQSALVGQSLSANGAQ